MTDSAWFTHTDEARPLPETGLLVFVGTGRKAVPDDHEKEITHPTPVTFLQFGTGERRPGRASRRSAGGRSAGRAPSSSITGGGVRHCFKPSNSSNSRNDYAVLGMIVQVCREHLVHSQTAQVPAKPSGSLCPGPSPLCMHGSRGPEGRPGLEPTFCVDPPISRLRPASHTLFFVWVCNAG